tara:strand:- start:537 stop:662 length:126 start_codon:yes stop_codon:yes gene_type:complete
VVIFYEETRPEEKNFRTEKKRKIGPKTTGKFKKKKKIKKII